MDVSSSWTNVTRFVTTNLTSQSHLSLDLTSSYYSGQLLKVMCSAKCVLVKVEGSISYPFDLNLLDPKDSGDGVQNQDRNVLGSREDGWMKLGVVVAVVVCIVVLCVVVTVVGYCCNKKLECCQKKVKKTQFGDAEMT